MIQNCKRLYGLKTFEYGGNLLKIGYNGKTLEGSIFLETDFDKLKKIVDQIKLTNKDQYDLYNELKQSLEIAIKKYENLLIYHNNDCIKAINLEIVYAKNCIDRIDIQMEYLNADK